MATRDREPRATALGWYETGPWPESEGAFAYAQIGKRGGRYIRIYIVPIYSRCSDALLSRLLKNSVLHPAGFHYISATFQHCCARGRAHSATTFSRCH
jgi:hypothetical protein